MNKIITILIVVFFLSGTISIAAEKDCSQYNKVTDWKRWKKCMKGDTVENKEKSDSFFSNPFKSINKKYKSLREKAPKTGVEIWKKLPSQKNKNK